MPNPDDVVETTAVEVTPTPAAKATPEELQAQLTAAETAKQQAFLEEYQALCNKYNMTLQPNINLVTTPRE